MLKLSLVLLLTVGLATASKAASPRPVCAVIVAPVLATIRITTNVAEAAIAAAKCRQGDRQARRLARRTARREKIAAIYSSYGCGCGNVGCGSAGCGSAGCGSAGEGEEVAPEAQLSYSAGYGPTDSDLVLEE